MWRFAVQEGELVAVAHRSISAQRIRKTGAVRTDTLSVAHGQLKLLAQPQLESFREAQRTSALQT
jgi:hypothetical protein